MWSGHYPQVVLQDTGAVLSERRDRCLAVPKGRARRAQRFNAGFLSGKRTSPVGDDRRYFAHGMFSFAPTGLGQVSWPMMNRRAIIRSSLRDSWPGGRFPGVKTPYLFSGCGRPRPQRRRHAQVGRIVRTSRVLPAFLRPRRAHSAKQIQNAGLFSRCPSGTKERGGPFFRQASNPIR